MITNDIWGVHDTSRTYGKLQAKDPILSEWWYSAESWLQKE